MRRQYVRKITLSSSTPPNPYHHHHHHYSQLLQKLALVEVLTPTLSILELMLIQGGFFWLGRWPNWASAKVTSHHATHPQTPSRLSLKLKSEQIVILLSWMEILQVGMTSFFP